MSLRRILLALALAVPWTLLAALGATQCGCGASQRTRVAVAVALGAAATAGAATAQACSTDQSCAEVAGTASVSALLVGIAAGAGAWLGEPTPTQIIMLPAGAPPLPIGAPVPGAAERPPPATSPAKPLDGSRTDPPIGAPKSSGAASPPEG